MGLSHDGTKTSAYYSGDKDPKSATSFGAIMGSSYKNSLTQWSNGNYANANNMEDDVAKLRAQLGTRRDEDANGKLPPALQANAGGKPTTAEGIIHSSTDVDVWPLAVATSGTLDITVSPWVAATQTQGGNLDVMLRLRNKKGAILATANPQSTVWANININVKAGTYFLEIDGVMADSSSAKTDYGSVGQYQISVVFPATGTTAAGTAVLDNIACYDDNYAGNNEYALAQRLAFDSNGELHLSNMVVCPSTTSKVSADWYSIALCAKQPLNVTLSYAQDGSVPPPTLTLYSDNVAINGQVVNGKTVVQLPAMDVDSVVYIEVSASKAVSYGLRLKSSYQCPEPPMPQQQPFEDVCRCDGDTMVATRRNKRYQVSFGQTCTNGHMVRACVKRMRGKSPITYSVDILDESNGSWTSKLTGSVDRPLKSTACFMWKVPAKQATKGQKYGISVNSGTAKYKLIYEGVTVDECQPV